MTTLFGFNFPTPNVTGLLSQSWIYIAVILLIAFVGIVALIIALFFLTYNKRVEVYENIGGGSKVVRTIKTRARLVKVGKGGEEVLFLLRPRLYRTAYGKKIAPNTYAFVVGEDGYWRNMAFGDFNLKTGILDVEPVDKDVRLAHVSIGNIIDSDYNPNKNLLIGMSIFLAIMSIVWIVGSYAMISKWSGAMEKNNMQQEQTAIKFQEIAQTQATTSQIIANAKLQNDDAFVPSGLTPADISGGG